MKKYTELKIGEETYKLHFPMQCVIAAEKELSSHNILTVLEQAKIRHIPPSLSDMYILFKYAVAGGNPEIKENEVEKLYYAAISEYSIPEILGTVILTLRDSGVLGEKADSGKKDILKKDIGAVTGSEE